MKITPSLFSQPSSTPTAPAPSDARRAFEALLSASSARQLVTKPAEPSSRQTLPGNQIQAASNLQDLPSEPIRGFERPGRVLDIKV
jgi:hypothetical protein